MTDRERATVVSIGAIADLLVCPACRGDLRVGTASIDCSGCGASYGYHDGIPLFARKGSAETWGEGGAAETSESYQENYQEVERARRYNEKYAKRFFKRLSTRREVLILRRLLSSQGACRRLLDIPSGGGRLSGEIAPAADLLIEADIAIGQILYGRESSTLAVPRLWMTASAFHIPFRDGSIDGTVCVRLCHHLPTPNERDRLVRELLRVSRRFAIMTFFDEDSLKNRIRRVARALGLNRKPPKRTMTAARVRELAREGGAELAACPRLAFYGSGHRYALMVKKT